MLDIGWTNQSIALDVNNDGSVTGADAVVAHQQWQLRGGSRNVDSISLPPGGPGSLPAGSGLFIDVDGDGFISYANDIERILDALPKVKFVLQALNTSNQPISSVNLGQDFKIRATVQDIRPIPGPHGEWGVFAASMDLTYDQAKVGFKGNMTFGSYFNSIPYFDGSAPGLINEILASQSGLLLAPGAGAIQFFDATFHAGGVADRYTVNEDGGTVPFAVLANDNVAGSAAIGGNPADLLPGNDVILCDLPDRVDPAGLQFTGTSINYSTPVINSNSYIISGFTQPTGSMGTVAFTPGSGNKTLNFTPAANVSGDTSFTYTITDGTGRSDTVTVNVTIREQNDAPTAVTDTVSTPEEAALAFSASSLLTNDLKGPAGESSQSLSFTGLVSSTTTQGGSVSYSSVTGQITYTPPANFSGVDSFQYTIQDNGTTNGLSDPKSATGTVNINVVAVNDPPSAANDSATTAEDAPLTIQFASLLSNDSPGAGESSSQTMTIISVANVSPAGGSVQLVGSTVVYTPPAHYSGPASFTYTMQDNGTTNGAPNPLTATATVNVTVTFVNDPPQVTGESLVVAEDGVLTITKASLLANDRAAPLGDTNESGQTISITSVQSPLPAAGGGNPAATVVVNGAGDIVFTPPPNYFGPASFTYTVTDSSGASRNGTVSITVTEVNDNPFGISDSVNTPEDIPLSIAASTLLFNDNPGNAYESGQSLSIGGVSAASAQGGTVVLNGSNVVYTPPANYSGSDSFTYTLTDNGTTNGVAAPKSTTVTVTVTIASVNDAPTAGADSKSALEDGGPITFAASTLLTNDSPGPANESGQTLTVTGVSPTSTGGGTVSLSGGIITYTPAANFEGIDSFTYTVSDGQSVNATATGTVNVNVIGANEAPIATNDTASTPEDTELVLQGTALTGNDNPGAGESSQILTVTGATIQQGGGTVSVIGGVLRYTPPAEFSGQVVIQYTVTDDGTTNGSPDPKSATGLLTVTVTAVNDPPVANPDARTTAEDTQLTFPASQLIANDSPGPANESTQTKTFVGVSSTSANGGAVAVVLVNNVQNVRYTPPANFVGDDTFTYTVRDNGSPQQVSTGTVTVTVTPMNDAPVGGQDTVTATEDTALAIPAASLTANDQPGPANESGQTLAVTAVARLVNQTNTANNTKGTVSLANGVITYTPPANYSGPDRFTYTVTDNGLNNTTAAPKSTVVTVIVNVTPVNDAPTAVSKTATVAEDGSLTITIASLLSGNNAGPSETGQTISLQAVATSTPGATVQIVGSNVVYTPPANFVGADTFSYTIVDNGTTNGVADPQTKTGTVTVTVTPVNDAPIPQPDTFLTDVNEAITFTQIQLTGNDAKGPANESNQTLKITAVGGAQNGTVSLNPTTGAITFRPNTGYLGPASFTYTVQDNGQTGTIAAPKTATGTVNITVGEINDAPVPVNDTRSTNEDTQLVISAASLLANDSKGATDEAGQILTLSLGSLTTAKGGTLTFDGTNITYTPPADFNGSDSFSYSATDDGLTLGSADPKSASGLVTITVNAVNDAPLAVADARTTAEDQVLTFAVSGLLTNDGKGAANESSQTLSFVSAATASAAGGTVQVVTVNNVQSIRYTPPANFNGSDSFTYVVKDNGTPNLSATGTVHVTVTEVNDPVSLVSDTATTAEDTPLVIDGSSLTANDSAGPNESGQTLSVTAVNPTTPGGGQVSLVSGQITYTPAANFFGVDTITLTVSDNGTTGGAANAKSATSTIQVTVTEVNDTPNGVDKTLFAVNSLGTQTLHVLTGDSKGAANESNQALTITGVTPGSAGGVIVANPDGTISYTPPSASFVGTETFTYTVTDNGTTSGSADPKSDTATVTVDVRDYVPNTFSGYLYFDPNDDGVRQSSERMIAGVDVTLSGTDVFNQPVSLTVKSGADGFFSFDNVVPGNYTLSAANAQFTLDGKDGAGTQGDTLTTDNDRFTFSTSIAAGTQGTNNRFAQRNLNGTALNNAALSTATTHFGGNGILLATKLDGTQFWQSFLGGWAGVKSASLQLNGTATSATLTIVDGANVTHTRTVAKAPATNLNQVNRFQIVGTAPNGAGYVIKVNGQLSDFGITSGQAPEAADLFFAALSQEMSKNEEKGK